MSLGSQTLEDMEARLSDLDRFHIDCQIVFPTMFLAAVAEDVNPRRAASRLQHARRSSMRQVKRPSQVGSVAPSLRPGGRSERDANGERWALRVFHHGHGVGAELAVRNFDMRRRGLTPSAFISVGARRRYLQLFADSHAFFCSAIVPVMWGFMYTIGAGQLTRFPKLRLGFLETGSAWVPYAMQQIRRRVEPPTVLFYHRAGARRLCNRPPLLP